MCVAAKTITSFSFPKQRKKTYSASKFLEPPHLSLGCVSLHTSQSSSDLSGTRCAQGPRATRHLDVALFAVPDSSGFPLHDLLSAKRAFIFGVLSDFNLLDNLSVGRAITSRILAHNANLNLFCAISKLIFFTRARGREGATTTGGEVRREGAPSAGTGRGQARQGGSHD